jgi:hypothetical protein
VSLQSAFALAPADRAPGNRGPRGRLAALVTLGSVVVLLLGRLHGTTSGGGGGGAGAGSWNYTFTFENGSWSTGGLMLAAALLLAGGAALWLARSPRTGVIATSLALAGAGALVLALGASGTRRLSPAMYQSIPVGVSQSVLMRGFGSPVSTDASATPDRGGAPLGCLVYQSSAPADSGPTAYLFCFAGGRLRAKAAM